MSSLPDRRFMEEITALLQKMVTVSTNEGKNYTGVLAGVDSHTFNLCLSDVKDDSGRFIHKLFLNGGRVVHISICRPWLIDSKESSREWSGSARVQALS
jgi:small nuclear ribonucleoprotein (snRNP)-like protein